MEQVPIRELRNHGGDVVDRVARGEPVTITYETIREEIDEILDPLL